MDDERRHSAPILLPDPEFLLEILPAGQFPDPQLESADAGILPRHAATAPIEETGLGVPPFQIRPARLRSAGPPHQYPARPDFAAREPVEQLVRAGQYQLMNAKRPASGSAVGPLVPGEFNHQVSGPEGGWDLAFRHPHCGIDRSLRPAANGGNRSGSVIELAEAGPHLKADAGAVADRRWRPRGISGWEVCHGVR